MNNKILEFYELKNKDIIIEFINEFPYIEEALIRAIDNIKIYFEDFDKVIIEHKYDFYSGSNDLFGGLKIDIYTRMSIKDGFYSMDDFDKEFFFRLPRHIRQTLLFDFQPL